jgi:hypothetical protein
MISAPHVQPLEGAMQSYKNHENVRRYRKLIAISDGDPCRDEARHQTLRLLAEEEAKKPQPRSCGPHVGPHD